MKTLREALPDATDDHDWELSQRFPDVPLPYMPVGGYVLIQDRAVVERTKGGVLLSGISQEKNEYQEKLGRVVAVGQLAGYDNLSVDPDPEARKLPDWPWYQLGDLVLCSAFSSTRERAVEIDGRKITFRLVPYQDVMARVTSVQQVLR